MQYVTRKEKIAVGVVLAAIVTVCCLLAFCGPARAAETTGPWMSATGAAPVPSASPFFQAQVGYVNGLLFGVGGGAKFKNGFELGGMAVFNKQHYDGGACIAGCFECSIEPSAKGHVGGVVTIRFP